jgi:hypothetical protein
MAGWQQESVQIVSLGLARFTLLKQKPKSIHQPGWRLP